MPTEPRLPLAARRSFRLALATGLALVLGHLLGLAFPFVAALFAFLLALNPAPPPGLRQLPVLLLLVGISTGLGLLLVPILQHQPLTGVLIGTLGIYLSFVFTLQLRQEALGLFLAIGFTFISVTGYGRFEMGLLMVQSLVFGIALGVIAAWLAYLPLPEDGPPAAPEAGAPSSEGVNNRWIALRGTLIVLPVWLLALTNPGLFMAGILKSVSLGQQSSEVDAAQAGRELVGSTFMGGLMALLFWNALSLLPSLWMYFLWTLLFALFVATRIHGIHASRWPADFWVNAFITQLILVGPAINDLATGKDVLQAFSARMALFLFISLYAWGAVRLLDRWRRGRPAATETAAC